MRKLSMSLFLLAVACAAMPVLGQAAKNSFSLTISTPSDSVKTGDQVRLDITITNTSDQDIQVVITHPEIFYDIDVHHNGDSARETDYGHRVHNRHTIPFGTVSPVVSGPLKPGDKVQEHYVLNDLYDFSDVGKYTVQVQQKDPKTKTFIKSNTITVTVTGNPS
jgi:hypothetical protein